MQGINCQINISAVRAIEELLPHVVFAIILSQIGKKFDRKSTSRADKVSDRFPVVRELFRHPEIANRLTDASVNRRLYDLHRRYEGKRKGTRRRT